jgi:hypothetical protein
MFKLQYYIYLDSIEFFDILKEINVPFNNTQVVIRANEDTKIPPSKYALVIKCEDSEKWYAKALTLDKSVKFLAIWKKTDSTSARINKELDKPSQERDDDFELIYVA